MHSPYRLEITGRGLFLDGAPFSLASGSFHYFRAHPSAWRHRLALMRAFGLTAVQTYAPWNLHEPRRGEFAFDGVLDLTAFLRAADAEGLKVLLRPSPYINSECDFGGLPWWLLQKPRAGLRCREPVFLDRVARYYGRLCREFTPMLSTRGGPIIAVAVENEYGSYGNDTGYLAFLRDCLAENGVDVPFYTTECARQHFVTGTLPGVWGAVNYRIESVDAIGDLLRFQPDLPPFVGEYWSGRAGYWGTPFHPRDPSQVAKAYRDALDLGAHVNFYMFCGGTNFGFFSGAKVVRPFDEPPGAPERYYANLTSYDVDALVGEDGRPTEKYHACRRELAAHRGETPPPMPEEPAPPQAIGPVRLTEAAALFDQLPALSRPVEHASPLCMEALDQGYGYILYTSRVRGERAEHAPLLLDGLGDRATVFVDGRFAGVYMRGEDSPPIHLSVPREGFTLSILVENCGRLSTGQGIERENKGIAGARLGGMRLFGWAMHPLPMDDLSALRFAENASIPDNAPAFYRGFFDAEPGRDTFLRTDGWEKGVAWINGFPLGRYWRVGPQETLYVPGGLLNAKRNELILFENHRPDARREALFVDKASLDGPLNREKSHSEEEGHHAREDFV